MQSTKQKGPPLALPELRTMRLTFGLVALSSIPASALAVTNAIPSKWASAFGIATAIGGIVAVFLIRWRLVGTSSQIVERNLQATRESNPARYARLVARLRGLSGDATVEVVISPRRDVTACALSTGNGLAVELTQGLIQRHAKLHKEWANSAIPDGLDAVLAHEAAHVARNDPWIYIWLLSVVGGALAAGLGAATVCAGALITHPAGVQLLPAVVPLIGLVGGWTALVGATELEADAAAGALVGRHAMRALLQDHSTAIGRRSVSLIALFLHPNLRRRVQLDVDEGISPIHDVLLAFGAANSVILATSVARSLLGLGASINYALIVRFIELSAWIGSFMLVLYPILYFRGLRPARSAGQVMARTGRYALFFAALYAASRLLDKAVSARTFLPGAIAVGVSMTAVVWATANIALILPNPTRSRRIAYVRGLASLVGLLLFCAAGVAIGYRALTVVAVWGVVNGCWAPDSLPNGAVAGVSCLTVASTVCFAIWFGLSRVSNRKQTEGDSDGGPH
jgi:Zn-dependent protease with chaperone function